MSSFLVDKNIIFRKRAGTQDDPFIFISEQITILNSQAILQESVDNFQGITIIKGEITYNYKEINNVLYNEVLPNTDTFVYNAEHGIIFADSSFNNQTLTISYWGVGSYFLNSKRIYTLTDDNGNITQTLGDLVDDGRQAIEALGGLATAISAAQTLEITLESDISTGGTLHTNLTNDISLGNPLQIALDGSIATASDSKIALDLSISNSTTSKDNLDGSILQGDILKSGLDLDIINGNLLHIDLDSDIVDGNILKGDLDSRIADSIIKKSDLDLSISTSGISKDNLDSSVSTANITKTNLDLSNVTALETKLSLDSSNSLALETKGLLDSSNSLSEILNTNLESSISDGNILKNDLDASIVLGNSSKSNLDNSISSATIINGTLDGTIETGNTSISELNATNTAFKLIEVYDPLHPYVPMNKVTYLGSTYQCILPSTGNLPTDIIYFILVAKKGLDGEGSGDMEKATYDTTNNGIVDNSEKLGGQLPSYYETTTGSQTKADTAETNAKSYTDTEIANLVDSAPETLDTLNELALALGDDPNFATTVTNLIGTKEPVISTKNTAFNKNYGIVVTDVKSNGIQSVGIVDGLARIDHIHPSDITKADVSITNDISDKINLLNGTSALNLTSIQDSSSRTTNITYKRSDTTTYKTIDYSNFDANNKPQTVVTKLYSSTSVLETTNTATVVWSTDGTYVISSSEVMS